MAATEPTGLLADLDWLRSLAIDARAITTVEAIDGLKRKYAAAAPATPCISSERGAPLNRLLKVLKLAYSKGGQRLMSVWIDDIGAVESAIAALGGSAEGGQAAGELRQLNPEDVASALREWMREPDFAEEFSLDKVVEWINRRPIALLERLIETRG